MAKKNGSRIIYEREDLYNLLSTCEIIKPYLLDRNESSRSSIPYDEEKDKYNIFAIHFVNTDRIYSKFKHFLTVKLHPDVTKDNKLVEIFTNAFSMMDDIEKDNPIPKRTNNYSNYTGVHPQKNRTDLEAEYRNKILFNIKYYKEYGEYNSLKTQIDILVTAAIDNCVNSILSGNENSNFFNTELRNLLIKIDAQFKIHFERKLNAFVSEKYGNYCYYKNLKDAIKKEIEDALKLLKNDKYKNYESTEKLLDTKIGNMFRKYRELRDKICKVINIFNNLDDEITLEDDYQELSNKFLTFYVNYNNLPLQEAIDTIDDIEKKLDLLIKRTKVKYHTDEDFNKAYSDLMFRYSSLFVDYNSLSKLDISSINSLLSLIAETVQQVIEGLIEPEEAINAFNQITFKDINQDKKVIASIKRIGINNSKIYVPLKDSYRLSTGVLCYLDDSSYELKMIYINNKGQVVQKKTISSEELNNDYMLLEDVLKKSNIECKFIISKNKDIITLISEIKLFSNMQVKAQIFSDNGYFYFSTREDYTFWEGGKNIRLFDMYSKNYDALVKDMKDYAEEAIRKSEGRKRS